MKILVVDDQRIFKSFPNLPEPGPDDEVVHTTTSQEFLRALYEHDWDEVYLDHDLGMVSEGSGTDIVKHIVDDFLPAVGKFFIHTMNPVGAVYMDSMLGSFYQTERIDPTPYLDFEAMYREDRNPWLAGPRR